MSISRLRLEALSFYNYIKYQIVPAYFSEQVSDEPLVYNTSLNAYLPQGTTDPDATSTGRGWVAFDDYVVGSRTIPDLSREQTSKVSVVGASSYTINYLNGCITNPNTTPTSVSYYWNYVSVVSSWPGANPPPLPFISVGIENSKKGGFQLGGGVKNIRTVYIDIFATTSSERDDISEVIHDALFDKYISILDFSDGSYLNFDGTFNTSLSLPVSSLGTIYFVDVDQRNSYFPSDWSDLNRYRSVVSGKYESLRDITD